MLSVAFSLFLVVSGAAQRAPDLARAGVAAAAAEPAQPVFAAPGRAVSNWRGEALDHLDPGVLVLTALLLKAERPVVSRCVKLNNYWCIKRARWNGELGADDEGHVGFATAGHGADAAVALLRRYYLDFGRRSALDIVRRWAPAECGLAAAGGITGLALRGIQNTLRARYLAALRGRVAARSAGAARTRPRVSAVPVRPLPTFRVPDIAIGLGERKVATMTGSLTPGAAKPAARSAVPARSAERQRPSPAMRPRPETVLAAAMPRPAPPCGTEQQRIQNYAGRIVERLALRPADDLKLFAEDGQPLPNLALVLAAMSAFELGHVRASARLVEAAIARAAARVRPVQAPEERVPAEGQALPGD